MKLYREVKASKRLPTEDGNYVVYINNDPNYRPMVLPFRENHSDKDFWETCLNWLEPVEISEEEIEEMAERFVANKYSEDFKNVWGTAIEDFIAGAKAILKKLEGDETT